MFRSKNWISFPYRRRSLWSLPSCYRFCHAAAGIRARLLGRRWWRRSPWKKLLNVSSKKGAQNRQHQQNDDSLNCNLQEKVHELSASAYKVNRVPYKSPGRREPRHAPLAAVILVTTESLGLIGEAGGRTRSMRSAETRSRRTNSKSNTGCLNQG